jgi:hypothetical protein
MADGRRWRRWRRGRKGRGDTHVWLSVEEFMRPASSSCAWTESKRRAKTARTRISHRGGLFIAPNGLVPRLLLCLGRVASRRFTRLLASFQTGLLEALLASTIAVYDIQRQARTGGGRAGGGAKGRKTTRWSLGLARLPPLPSLFAPLGAFQLIP